MPANRDRTTFHPDPDVVALGIRQPWAELILRGVKTIEVRSLDTQVRGTIYLYAGKKLSRLPAAAHAAKRHGLDLESLPTGLLVGSVEILSTSRAGPEHAAAACVPAEVLEQQYAWRLGNPQRFTPPLAVRFLPYGVWFYPFQRRK